MINNLSNSAPTWCKTKNEWLIHYFTPTNKKISYSYLSINTCMTDELPIQIIINLSCLCPPPGLLILHPKYFHMHSYYNIKNMTNNYCMFQNITIEYWKGQPKQLHKKQQLYRKEHYVYIVWTKKWEGTFSCFHVTLPCLYEFITHKIINFP